MKKPESPNQDSWQILKVDQDMSIYGVFDGFGQKGHDVSNFVSEHMTVVMLQDKRFKTEEYSDVFRTCFEKAHTTVDMATQQKKLNAEMSGTTASVVIRNGKNNKLTVANVGDSTIVIGLYTDASKSQLVAKTLTRDHRPFLPEEKRRIEMAGGRVVFDGYCNHRVFAKGAPYPALNLSRCIGELVGHAKCGLSCEPDITEVDVTPLDHVLLLGSSGLWQFISPQEALDIVAKFSPQAAMQAAEELTKNAYNRWNLEEEGTIVDDITVVVAYL